MRAKASPRKNTQRNRGVLFLISAIFFASVITRLIDGTGELFAKEIETLGESSGFNTSEADQSVDGGYTSEQLKELIVVLKDREHAIAKKEMAIKGRLQALLVAETAFKKNIQDLTNAENALRATMALASTAAEDDLARLTSVYENMKPKDASALFEEMDPEFSAGFLGRMRPESAALVMAGLSPNTAYSISVILAGRNASVPTE